MKRYSILSLVLFLVVALNLNLTAAGPIFAQPTDPQIKLDPKYKTPRYINEIWKNAKLKNKQDMVWSYLESKKQLFKFNNNVKENFKILKEETDQLGQTHYRLQQIHHNIPVYGADQTIHLDKQQQVHAYFGQFVPGLEQKQIPTKAKISEQNAINTMQKDLKLSSLDGKPKVKQWIYPFQDNYYLAYEIKFSTVKPAPGYWHYYIDATNGKIIQKFNAIHNVKGQGKGVFGDTKTFEVTCASGQSSCTLYDQTRGRGIKTHDAQNKNYNDRSLPGPLISSATTTFNEPAGVDAHTYLSATYDYFKKTFNRNSFDNNGAPIISSVHVGNKWNNAAWNGEQILFGDGDGTNFTVFSASLDVAAHELTHAITERTANLQYFFESGALNESMSDIFGAMVDPDYLIGEDIYTPNREGDALRSMEDPPKYNQPDHYRDRYIGLEDNGGVHINSGINNKAAYLLMEGGTHNRVSVNKIGRDKTAKIYYRALTLYLTSSSNFSDMRQAAIKSAADLYGQNSSEVTAVKKAYDSVGVR